MANFEHSARRIKIQTYWKGKNINHFADGVIVFVDII